MSFQDIEFARLAGEYFKRSTIYKSGKKNFNYFNVNLFQPLVADFLPDFYTWLNLIVQSTQERTGRNPSLEELAEGLDEIFLSYPKSVVLRLTFREGTQKELDEILRQVKNRLKKRVLRTRFSKNDLEVYLNVYDLRKAGFSNDEVILKIGSKEEKQAIELAKSENQELDVDAESIRQNYRRCFKKARKIIENIENGKFPGNY